MLPERLLKRLHFKYNGSSLVRVNTHLKVRVSKSENVFRQVHVELRRNQHPSLLHWLSHIFAQCLLIFTQNLTEHTISASILKT